MYLVMLFLYACRILFFALKCERYSQFKNNKSLEEIMKKRMKKIDFIIHNMNNILFSISGLVLRRQKKFYVKYFQEDFMNLETLFLIF